MAKNPRPDSPRIRYWEAVFKNVDVDGKYAKVQRDWQEERLKGGRDRDFFAGRSGGILDGIYLGYRFAQVETAQALYGDGDNGVTQAQVADAVGTSQATVSRLLKDPDPLEEWQKRMRERRTNDE